MLRTTLSEQIEQLEQQSPREKEILACSPKGRITKDLVQEFRQLEDQREQQRKQLITQGWQILQGLGYTKYDRRGNADVESGHSDHDDGYYSEGFYVFWGVVAPDGTEFPGETYWSEGIIPAIKYANLAAI